MSETKTKNLCTVPAADLTDSQYFIAEDGGELKRIPKAQVVLKKLEKMLATDTENLAGGGEVTAQELLDALAEQVANKLLAKSQVVNNLLATVEGNPLDATQGKALKKLIDTTNNNLSKAVYTDDIFITTERPTFVYWNGNTKNTPFKSGLTSCTEGFAFSYGAWAGYMTVVCFVKNDSTMWIWSKSRNAWVEYAAKSDLEPVKSRQINTYTSANKDTDAILSSYESKNENFILLFTSNDATGTIPTLTGSHLFVIEHLLVGDDSASAIERAYSTKGKLIAWRFKQWWDKTWTAWEN